MAGETIHRVRFFDFIPKPVQCMAYEDTSQKLAVAREDANCGIIDIYDIREKWLLERTLLPTKSVDAMVWCHGRLFSAGVHGSIHEHDLENGGIKSSTPSHNGAIWCLARNAAGTKIAAGTEDGCVVLFDIYTEDIQYERALDKQEGRILSIAWHEEENAIVTGGVDNIRVWGVTSGRAVQRMAVGKDGDKDTIVWAIAVTADLTIVSGDSRGKTCFWNGRMGTRIKSFKCHSADVYSVCVTPDGKTAFSTGVDPQVVRFQLNSCSGPDSDWPVWVKGSSRTVHTNDVRTLLLARDSIISAGLDCQIVSDLIDNKSKRRTLRISPIPLVPTVQTVPNINGILLRYPHRLELWKLGSTNGCFDKDWEVYPLSSVPRNLLVLKTKPGASEIVCSAVSQCGGWVAYSDDGSVKLYNVTLEDLESEEVKVSIKRVNCSPVTKQFGAHCLAFTPDGTTLVVASRDGSLLLLNVGVEKLPSVKKILTMPEGSSGPVKLLAVSACGRYLAVAQLTRAVHIYDLKKLRHYWTLPAWTHQPTAMAFSPAVSELFVVYSDRKIVEYSIKGRELTPWSRTVADYFHPTFSTRPNKIRGVTYNPQQPHEILLHDDELYYVIDKTVALPGKHVRLLQSDRKLDRKRDRKRGTSEDTPHGLYVGDQYKYLMHVDILPDGSQVVVERPELALAEALPPPAKRKRFGV